MLGLRFMDKDFSIPTSDGGPRDVSQLALPSSLRILVLAPHPDDFDAIAVTLQFLSRNGNPIAAGVALTGSGVEDDYLPGLTRADRTALREQEQRRSLQFFGLPDNCLTFLSLSNDEGDQPKDCPENFAALQALVAEKTPDVVFLPHGNDTNSGHRVMYSLLVKIAQRSDRMLTALLNRDPKTIDMRIHLYMPFGQEEAVWKAEMLRFHDSQHQRNLRSRGHGFDDRILALNRAIAQELSLARKYAEAFELASFGTE